MKICFFSGDITRSGGTERVAIMIANELAKCERYEVVFLSLCQQKEETAFELDEKIVRYSLGDHWITPGPGYLKILPKLRKFLREQKIEVVVDIDIVLDVLSVWARGKMKIAVISWEHFNYRQEMKTFYRKVIMHTFTRRADCIVVLTKKDADTFKAGLRGSGPVHVIHNPMKEKKQGLSFAKKKQIVTVGSVIWDKGIDMLAPIALHVLKAQKDWKWIVAGTGEMESFLQDYIKEHGLENQLIAAGHVADVDALLAESDFFVMTSRHEGLPMCLLEAKAYGLPCVSFDVETGPDEIIRDGINGYLVKPFCTEKMEERIRLLMQDDKLRSDFSEKAVLDKEKFGMETIIGQWKEILAEVTM